jgi:hypothetical protein
VVTSTAGIVRLSGRPFAIAGLVFGIPAALLMCASNPAVAVMVGIPAVALGLTVTWWR